MPLRTLPMLSLVVLLAGGLAACSDDSGSPDGGGPTADADPAAPDAAPMVCEVVAPAECPDPSPVFADIEPIIADRCLGCHDGTTENWPLTTYQHVAAWYAEIRGAMLDCAMPPEDSGITMPTAERELILAWIRCGFPQ